MSVSVDEILSAKQNAKRLQINGASISADENREPPIKKSRLDSLPSASSALPSSNLGFAQDLLLQSLDEVEQVEPVDEKLVRKLISTFEKRVAKNQEMRMKFSDQPDKFMESEIELNVSIQEMHTLGTAPQFYNFLADSNIVQQILYTLNHENTDISCAVVYLLQELTDIDALNENEDAADLISNWIIEEGQIIGALVKNLERLDEVNNKDEADGVYNTLTVIENIFEFKPEELVPHLLRYGFLGWLLKRLKAKIPFDSNTLYCSELLSVLLQSSELCQKSLGQDLDGIDVLLQQLATFKRHNPKDQDEVEYMENLFDALCASLMLSDNLRKFLDGEGLQLMNLMLREKKMSRSSALKVLDYATTGKAAKDNCDKFVDILGLRTLFPLFMKTPAKHQRKGHTVEEHEEHSCAIIASLLKNCSPAHRQRLLAKFIESDCEKVERLMELHFKYMDKVNRFETELENKLGDQEEEEDDEEEIYVKKLDAGLFTLQLVDFILAEVCVNGPSPVKERVLKILKMKNSSVDALKRILKRYADSLGEKGDEREYILATLCSKL